MSMFGYLASKYAELQGDESPVIAGVGLVLDTRANAAAALLRRLEGEARNLEEEDASSQEMSDLSGGGSQPRGGGRLFAGDVSPLGGGARNLEEEDASSQEMSDLSGGAKSPLAVLKGQIALARLEAAAARGQIALARLEAAASREDDGVVVDKQHLEGTAHKSGQVDNGDMVVAVNGTPIGMDLEEAGRLIRGPVNSKVSLTVRKMAGGHSSHLRIEVNLERKRLEDHPMGPHHSFW